MLRTCTSVAAGLLLAVAIAACGGSSKPSHSASASAHSNAIAFSECMRANGVPNFPDPGSNGGGGIQISASQTSGSGRSLRINGVSVSAPAFQSASHKCQRYMPHGPPLTASQVQRLRAGALAMAKCMRAHGVTNFPDPVVSAGPGGQGVSVKVGAGPNSGFTPAAPAFQAAQKACGGILGIGIKGAAPAGGAKSP